MPLFLGKNFVLGPTSFVKGFGVGFEAESAVAGAVVAGVEQDATIYQRVRLCPLACPR